MECPNAEIIGIDIEKSRIKRAQDNLKQFQNITFTTGNATKLKFKSSYFDCIVIHHVIEHIPDDKKVMRECARVLKRGGYLIIGIPNEGSAIGKLLRIVEAPRYKLSEHIHFYSAESMSELMRTGGFKAVDIRGFGFLFPFFPVVWFILWCTPLFKFCNWITQKVSFTADSLFLVGKKR